MYSSRSSKLEKSSKKVHKGPGPYKDDVQHKRRSTRNREPMDVFLVSDEGTDSDLIFVEKEAECAHLASEDKGKPLQLVDDVTDPILDEDQGILSSHSVDSFSSTLSGPSYFVSDPCVMQNSPLDLCSDCQKMYKKAKRMKRPLKNKMLDNDPKSLTCDQWILEKKWRPRRRHHVKGRLWTSLRVINKRCNEKQQDQCNGNGKQLACSRPHIFLQRNLRHCVKVLKRGKQQIRRGRKRSRDITHEPNFTKRQHLNINSCHSITVPQNASPCPSYSSDPSLGAGGEDDDSCPHLTFKVIPSSVAIETQSAKAPTKEEVPIKKRGFRDLLTQLRGNNSMIIDESCL